MQEERALKTNEDIILEYERVLALGRRKQLKELRQKNRVEILCLQETIKVGLSSGDLYSISEGGNFEWVWTVAQGHSGRTLIGVRTDDITVISKDKGELFTSMKISSRHDKIEWEVVNVYGPVQIKRKADFLADLGRKIVDMGVTFYNRGIFQFNKIRLGEIL
jgi:hypothetical protein